MAHQNQFGDAMSLSFDIELDTCGLNCPLPILKAKKSLSAMQPGQVLKITSTDPGALRDFAAFAKQTGNDLLLQETEGDKFSFWLKRR
jgi:TusA-related sulfurtransferase